MSGDLRGFVYGLEPVRRRRQWQLDAAQTRLGRIETELREVRAERDTLQALHKVAQQEAAQALRGSFDPAQHRRSLAWLARQRNELDGLDARIAALQGDRDAARRECLTLQRKLDLIETHRDDCVADHVREDLRRQAVEADRDWLARRVSASDETDRFEVLR